MTFLSVLFHRVQNYTYSHTRSKKRSSFIKDNTGITSTKNVKINDTEDLIPRKTYVKILYTILQNRFTLSSFVQQVRTMTHNFLLKKNKLLYRFQCFQLWLSNTLFCIMSLKRDCARSTSFLRSSITRLSADKVEGEKQNKQKKKWEYHY